MASTCRSCGAAIVWALTITGKRAPFTEDAEGAWSMVDGCAVSRGPTPKSLKDVSGSLTPPQSFQYLPPETEVCKEGK